MPLDVSKDSPSTIKEFLEAKAANPSFLVVYASPRPTDGLMWCGDCRRAEPLINEKFTKRPQDVKVAYAGGESEWRIPTNPYRQPPFLIEKLPTIIKVTASGWERLVEQDCYDQTKLDAFVGQ